MWKFGVRKHSFVQAFLFAILLAVFLRFFVVGIYKVPTSSMLPNLYVGDVIFAWKYPYTFLGKISSSILAGDWGEIKRGDIVVFKHPKNSSLYVKRVVAVAGDKISVTKGILSINEIAYSYNPKSSVDDFAGAEHFQISSESSDTQSWNILLQSGVFQADVSETVVPRDSVYVVGDNRNSSDDSRDWGPVSISNVEARVVFCLLSFNWKKESGQSILRSGRSFKTLN